MSEYSRRIDRFNVRPELRPTFDFIVSRGCPVCCSVPIVEELPDTAEKRAVCPAGHAEARGSNLAEVADNWRMATAPTSEPLK